MNKVVIGYLCALHFISSCGTGKNPEDETFKIESSSDGSKNQPNSNASTVDNTSSEGGIPTNSSCSNTLSSTIPPFSFEEAQSKCASCHTSANQKWSTGGGNVEDWRAVAASLRLAVENDSMPLPPFSPSTNDKARFLLFLDQLQEKDCSTVLAGGGVPSSDGMGGTSPTPVPSSTPATPMPETQPTQLPTSSSTPASTPASTPKGGGKNSTPAPETTATPTPITYNFSTASPLCTGCHGSGSRHLNLDTEENWRSNKTLIYSRVNDGTMPVSITLTAEQRNALLNYINSL